MAPPTCCIVLTSAEATPASWLRTPAVAVLMVTAKITPKPRPMTITAGRMTAAELDVTGGWGREGLAPGLGSMPGGIRAPGPAPGSAPMRDKGKPTQRAPTKGRNKKPDGT